MSTPLRSKLYVLPSMAPLALAMLQEAGVLDASPYTIDWYSDHYGVPIRFTVADRATAHRVLEAGAALVAIGAAPMDGAVVTPYEYASLLRAFTT